jgi:ATP-dependent RNA helicase DHX8/PRP22
MAHLFSAHVAHKRRRSRSCSADYAEMAEPASSTNKSLRVSPKEESISSTSSTFCQEKEATSTTNYQTAKTSSHRKSTGTSVPGLVADAEQLPVHAYKEQIMDAVLQNTHNSRNNDANSNQPHNKIVFIMAATGSGKSTQIPSYFVSSNTNGISSLAHNGSGGGGHVKHQRNIMTRIAVTQPRRVAAITLAQRVISERRLKQPSPPPLHLQLPELPPQQLIGYRVRFQDTTCGTTQLVYITDGMLLREAMIDPLLLQYSIIFLDEAHERSLQTDILLGIVKSAQEKRQQGYHPLRVVIMSATLQLQPLIDYFGGNDSVTIIQIPGRQYPVQILYTATPQDDYLESSLATILQLHDAELANHRSLDQNNNYNGDILVFLPGQEEIESLAILLKQHLSIRDRSAQSSAAKTNLWTGDRVEVLNSDHAAMTERNSCHSGFVMEAGVMICVLYAALPADVQLNAFIEKPKGCIRKVILATNIAETSVTIPAIRYVIDTGKYKCRYMASNTGMECLTIADISQAQAIQRAGRAGRVQAGICFRLYTEEAFSNLAETSIPEILRVNLAQVVLQLKGMGIHDPTTFEFVTPPDQQSLIRAIKLLYALSALDDTMQLTEYGKKLAKLPLDPIYGHLLLQSAEYSCVNEMLTVVSVLSAENLFYRPSGEGIVSSKATAAHRRFISHEGDLPTYLNVYAAWQREAIYVAPTSGGRKAQKRILKHDPKAGVGTKLLLHGDWCQQNFISGRSLSRAFSVRKQLQKLCERPVIQNGLGMDVTTSCDQDRERFLKCIASGLFLQVASRIKIDDNVNQGRGRAGQIISSRGRYRTKIGNETVSVHPTSSMFNRQPAPKCVVYTELIVTKKSYIRGVTQIREEWLSEVAPVFYRDQKENAAKPFNL